MLHVFPEYKKIWLALESIIFMFFAALIHDQRPVWLCIALRFQVCLHFLSWNFWLSGSIRSSLLSCINPGMWNHFSEFTCHGPDNREFRPISCSPCACICVTRTFPWETWTVRMPVLRISRSFRRKVIRKGKKCLRGSVHGFINKAPTPEPPILPIKRSCHC